jgi:CheY-like chemotaxis protein
VFVLSSLSSVLTALSNYLWPLVAAVVLWVLMPTIKKVLETRSFSIKVGSMDVTVQEASQNLQKQISDLQGEVSAMKVQIAALPAPVAPTDLGRAGAARPAAGAPPEGTGPSAGETPGDAAAATVILAASAVEGPGFASILWVDDELVNVAYEVSILQNRGVIVVTATSTQDALRKLTGVQAVVTDSARTEDGHFNPRAGIDLIRSVHSARPGLPVFIYTLASIAQQIENEALGAGAAGVFSSSVEIIARLGPPPPP